MKILFVASECMPFVKTGGLADVVGSLPNEIAKQGADVRVILPLYREIPEQWRQKMKHLLFFYVNLGWRRQYCGIETLEHNGVTYYFVDNQFYFSRDSVYGYGNDEGERFAFFCRSVLESLPLIGFMPDIIHANDWQSGMIPALLKIQYNNIAGYKNIKTVFTIHNLKYQGIFPWGWIDDMLGIGDAYLRNGMLEYYGCINFLKGGIVFSDEVTTVSPTYAKEVQMQWYGEQLDGLLRSRADHFRGILNGIDTKEYDPKTDQSIAANYNERTARSKAACKMALQEELGLEKREDAPLIAMVSRLTDQKGLDLIECVLEDIMRMDVQLAFLGVGDERYQELLSWAQWRYQGRIGVRIEVNESLSRKFFAGSDIFLMPSQFEPCGLSQMIAMRYGSVPIVRETGGLKDTVEPYNKFTNEGTGFSFANYNAHEMLSIIESAVSLYHDKAVWEGLIGRAMRKDYGWDTSAKHYFELYETILAPPAKTIPLGEAAPEEAGPVGEAAEAIKKAAEAGVKKAAESAKKAAETVADGAKKTAKGAKKAAEAVADGAKKAAAKAKEDSEAVAAKAGEKAAKAKKAVKKDVAKAAKAISKAADAAATKLDM